MANKKFKMQLGSWFVGASTGALLGWAIGGALPTLLNRFISNIEPNSSIILYVSIIVFTLFGFLLDLKYPIFAESLSYGITLIIFTQAVWDLASGSWSLWKSNVALISLVIFIVNLFTGYLKVNSAKKILDRQLGVK